MESGYSFEELNSLELIRIALLVQYDGNDFHGWQKQPKTITIQGKLEDAISQFYIRKLVKVVAAGRTDSGVHAAGQVVHFDYSGPIKPERWPSALNGKLPKTIRVIEAVKRPLTWHSCYSAIYRRYRYTIYNGCRPNLFLDPWSWHRYQFRLDEALMRSALENLVGHYDFSAFQRSGSNRTHSFTTIQEVQLERHGDLIVLEIQASGFLYGMVRLLVGRLVALGEHRISLDSFERCWKECRREEVKEAAPAKGLCFLRAGYEESFFRELTWFDSCPRYFLSTSNSPKEPPPFLE